MLACQVCQRMVGPGTFSVVFAAGPATERQTWHADFSTTPGLPADAAAAPIIVCDEEAGICDEAPKSSNDF